MRRWYRYAGQGTKSWLTAIRKIKHAPGIWQDMIPATQPSTDRASWRVSLLLAVTLAILLTLTRTLAEWPALRLLRLPDNDDMMRLAQIRDWIGGQRLNDLMQYRLGPPGGAPMHWSRLADAVPAAMILTLTPLVGAHWAEVSAVIAWPALLLFLYLLLAAHIATTLGGRAARPVAILLAAIAFPTIILFVPGRIDHHALQIVLIFALAAGLIGRPSTANGAAMGLIAVATLAIGLESAPELVAAMAGLGCLWLTGNAAEDARARGFGATLLLGTGLMLAFLHPDAWPRQWCDGFTPASTSAALALGAGWVALGLAGRRARGWRMRLVAAALIGAVVALSVMQTSMVCLAGPYDALHPFLKQAWMANVSEARGLFFEQNSPGTILAFGALSTIGSLAAIVQAVRSADRRWIAFAVLLCISLIAAIAQVRVTYILAGLATIPMAVRIAASNDRADLFRRLGWWAAGSGILWYLMGVGLDRIVARPEAQARRIYDDCVRAAPFLMVGRLPTGTIMAPINDGAYFIGLTRHHVVAAPYHRNNSGNLASYRFFLGSPDRAQAMARRWAIDYVAVCPGDLREHNIERLRAGSLIELLQRGDTPAWLVPVATGGTLRAFRVVDAERLSNGGGGD